MNRWFVFLMCIVMIAIGSTITAGQVMQEGAKEQKLKVSQLPAAVVEAIKTNCQGCAIDKATREIENGVTVYDIEFKRGQGEIALTEDGSVIDPRPLYRSEMCPRLRSMPYARARRERR